ncbi:peptidase M15 [Roseateles aquatilis]|uniref:Peptidase M15 n=1 Tax=Roseateles aquatilis TaxID=431061 RepID=A0A246JHK9_9BURK|nr:M15 family metallopeptidase [Roseateles aquatilis]OWQ92042.1 peptidase M15 [Roseateles aquatilis]
MTFKFSTASEQRLVGVHPHLVNVVRLALSISPLDFSVTEGLRTKERQAQLVKAGASRTMNSRHLTGHAVDLAAFLEGRVSWDWLLYRRLNDEAMQPAAKELGIPIVWGGSWVNFPDGPHWELNRVSYP